MDRNEYRFTELIQSLPELNSETLYHLAQRVEDSPEILPDEVCVTLGLPTGSTFAEGAEEVFAYQRHNFPELVETWA